MRPKDLLLKLFSKTAEPDMEMKPRPAILTLPILTPFTVMRCHPDILLEDKEGHQQTFSFEDFTEVFEGIELSRGNKIMLYEELLHPYKEGVVERKIVTKLHVEFNPCHTCSYQANVG